VIVIGYGTQKRSHLTGAVGTVDVKGIQDMPVGNLSEALKGQIVGVGVSGGYSRPGEPATITIRNPVFLSKDGGSKEPLYVIDDVIRNKNDFDLLDASEIESISVLKDAAAAIYGIMGSNGVIIVKTKRGKAGAPTINYSASYGITDAIKMPKMMSGYQQAQYLNDYNWASKNNSVADPANWVYDSTNTAIYRSDELEYFKTHNYNWLDMAWQTAQQTRHALNVSGGTDRATYFAGLSYDGQNSNFDGLRYNRYSFRASTDMKVANGLKVALSVSGNMSDKKNTYNKQGNESLDNDWKTLIGMPQFDPPFVNGLPVLVQGTGTSASINNYHYFAVHNSDNYTRTKTAGLNVLGQITWDVPFVKGLRASVYYNRNLNNAWGKQYGTYYNVYSFNMLGSNKHIYGDSATNTYAFKNGDFVRLNPTIADEYRLNATVNYARNFGKHGITVLAGYEQMESYTDNIAGLANGVMQNGGQDNQNFTTGAQSSTETESEFGRLAYIGRIDYNYDSKYLLEVQFRADASPNFAPENRWGYFPSVSAGWVVSAEPFFQNALNYVNYLKIRGSYGHMGLDATKGYQWARYYQMQTGKAAVFGGTADRGLGISTDVDMANRDVTWDDVNKLNGGLDMKFLNNRLSASVDGFIDFRRHMLTSKTSAPSYLIGTPIPTENYAAVNTFGSEITLNWRDRINKDWSYNITANFYWNDNKNLIGDYTVGNLGTYLDPTGKSSDMGFLGYKSLGMFRTKEEVDNWLAKYPNYKIFGNKPLPGMLYFEDIRGPKDGSGKYTGPDGTITIEDMDYLSKKAESHYSLGLNWGVGYKSFTLNVVMGMSFGGVNSVEGSARKVGNAYSNRPAFWADHWSPQNPNAKYPAPYYTGSYDLATDFWWRSNYTFRVTNFNLSYVLPQSIISKAGFSGARLYLVGTNPINFFNPFDYKDNANGSYDVYPQLRSFNLGLNVSL
jgi:TonB-linked SusC/RagA family outer membrane protein